MTAMSGRTGARKVGAGGAYPVARACGVGLGWALRLAARAALAVLTLACIAAGMAWVELRKGPIPIPAVARLAEEAFNAGSATAEVEVGSAVFALGRRSGIPSLRFRDVRIRDAETGELLLSVPALGARFSLPDLIEGRLRPLGVTILRPSAQLVRGVDGRFRFALGGSAEAPTVPQRPPLPDNLRAEVPPGARPPRIALVPAGPDDGPPAAAAVTRILDGLAGTDTPVPETERLTRISIRDARLTYLNEATGESFTTDRATLTLSRDADALRGVLDLAIGEHGIELSVEAERPIGSDDTRVDAAFWGAAPPKIAAELPEVAFLELIDAPVSGVLSTTFGADGRLGEVKGQIAATEGRLLEGTAATPFEALTIDFRVDPGAERLDIDDFRLVASGSFASVSGFVESGRGRDGGLASLAGQLAIEQLEIERPGLFGETLSFDSGQVVGRVMLEPLRVEVASARLGQGEMTLDVSGRADAGPEGWTGDLRATGQGISVADLKAHWPLDAAPNARDWVVENLVSGTVNDLLVQLRVGGVEPVLSLDFAFRDLVSRYLGEMPEIRGARGRGHLGLHDFHLALAEGHVEPRPGDRVDLGGSTLHISDLNGAVTPADIRLKGAGSLAAHLALIDAPPLGLVSRLDAPLGTPSGTARVEADLFFPLVEDLLMEDIELDARADLRDVAMTAPIGGGLPVAAEALELTATVDEMTISGDLRADGVPLTLAWREVYGETPGRREISLRGSATPALLARFGAEAPQFRDGRMGVTARLTQLGAGPFAIEADADLGPAVLAVPEIGWSKPAGAAARLRVAGTFGEAVRLDRVALDAPGLSFSGSAALAQGGALVSARLRDVKVRGLADVDLDVAPVGEDGFSVTLRGRRLDLALLDADGSGGEGRGGGGPRVALDFALDTLFVTETVPVSNARGQLRRDREGGIAADFSGDIRGTAPVEGSVSLPARGDGTLALRSPDAGAFLRATEIATGSRGGTLALDATLEGGGFDAITGTVRMNDVTLSQDETFAQIVEEGGLGREAAEPEGGGFRFRRVEMPFDYRGRIITLGETVATSPRLAVKVEGTVNEETGALDLVGVISPAYAISGFLDNIPVLGRILTGGRGEGILAMTFSVQGTTENPRIGVNPLSILTPGILRSVFSGRARRPDERFLESLGRPD